MRYTVVKKGDTLGKIARQFGYDLETIRKINPDVEGDTIYIGQKLFIPSITTTQGSSEVKQTYSSASNNDTWNYPVLPLRNYNNNVGKFLDEAYYRIVGADHNGCDINGNGGGNTDYGDPIYSVHSGIVVACGYLPVWGNIIKIDCGEVYASYAHLKEMHVNKGDMVSGRQVIGTMGRGANNIYISHLHFEIEPKLEGVPMLPLGFWPAKRGIPRSQVRNTIAYRYKDGMNFLRDKGASTT